jgi:3-phosphoglycerate kinase
MTKANGTDAKTVALYFLDATTDKRYTKGVIAKAISQAKFVLEAGYTVQEICDTIDYIIAQGIMPYSFGYINASIQNVIKEVQKQKLAEQGKELKAKMKEEIVLNEVNDHGESSERNQRKAREFGIQSGKRKKHHFDMFERD